MGSALAFRELERRTFCRVGRAAWPALMLVALLSGCGDDPLSVTLGGARPVAGYGEHTVTLSDGRTLRFTSWMEVVPRQSRPPLVVALHGGGTVYPHVGGSYLRSLPKPALQELGAVFVAPDLPAGSWTYPDGYGAVVALVEALTEQWPVDPDRVVLTGYSNGGLGVWTLTSVYPDRFVAAIPVASEVLAGSMTGADRTPMFVVHGTGDEVFDFDEVQRKTAALEDAGANVVLRPVPDASHTPASSYVAAMSEAVPWLRDLFSDLQ